MYWSMVGWSHHHTPLEIREKLAFSKEQVGDALRKLLVEFPESESVLLSTCNRVELYSAASEQHKLPQPEQLGSFLTRFHNADLSDVREQLTTLQGEDAIKHLFMVAASLDSMIVGEAQILSQVKAAYEMACEGETASALMHLAFQRATTVARRVANETEIHRRRISVPSIAVSEIASEFFERFDDKNILLIGAGEMGEETLRYLVEAGAKNIRIINRNIARSESLATKFSAQISTWDGLTECLAAADLIISTTSSPEPIISLDLFKNSRSRSAGSVLILDLAVPRDFDASIVQLPDVYLYTVDDLQQVCDRNIRARQTQWPKAERIVNQEVSKFLQESVHRSSGVTIKRLREQADEIKQEELRRLTNRLKQHAVAEQVNKEIEIAFDRLVNKLLHPPLKTLRDSADSTHHATMLESLRRLFQIKED
ncbi:MAG: glutamyl-tRNA reductase [Planctomycetales bacterium]|nr:glutamyl-tRNA reductase [Planctomycetales bacterium]